MKRWLVLTAVTLAAAAAWWGRGARGPEPPALGDLGPMDPSVAAFIGERIERVSDVPRSAPAWAALGVACEANGFPAAAERAFDIATTLAPSNARWWYRLSLIRSGRGDLPGAFAALDRVLALEPAYAPASWRRGFWLLDQGDSQSAEAAFRRATEIDAADAGGWLGLARVFLARRDEQSAVNTLERLLTDHPGERYALQLLGTAYRRMGRDDDARFALAVGTGSGPALRDPWSDEVADARRGFAASLKQATQLAMAGQFAAAIPLLEQLRAQKPDDVNLLTHLGGVYAAAGRRTDAVALLESVLARQPDNFDAHLNLATAHFFNRDVNRAAVHAGRALALRPGSAKAHETQGMILWHSRRTAEAIDMLERAISLDPRDPQPRVWIGMILVENRQPGRALPFFEEALRHDPLFVDALVGVGLVQIHQGAFEEARLTLRRAAQVDPESAQLKSAEDLLQRSVARR